MTATLSDPEPDTDGYGVADATARYLLTELAKLARKMPDVAPVAAHLDGVLQPARIRPPYPGQTVMRCGGDCGRALDLAQMRWWPRPMGNAATLRVGCPACIAFAQVRLA